MRNSSYLVVASCLLALVSCGRGPDRLGQALLSGRWGPVLHDIGATPNGGASAILRAHTLLLRNRNNEAVCEFLKADPPAWREYESVTGRLVKSYPVSAAAYYLAGDAYARSSRWAEAIASFDRALRTDPRFAPALVARGVALVSSGKVAAGKLDLYSASMLDPGLAEARAAMGWTLLKEGQPAASARNYFEAAFKLSPGYALADAGKGFAEIAAGDEEKGTDIVTGQLKSGACSSALLAVNSVLAAGWMRGRPGDAEDGVAPGTEIRSMLNDTFAGIARGDFKDFENGVRFVGINQSLAPMMTKSLSQLHAQHPEIYDRWASAMPSYEDHTRPGGLADTLIDAAKHLIGTHENVLNWALNDRLNQQSINTRFDHTGFTITDQIMNIVKPQSVPRPTPGGATTSLNAARVDRGHWPFKPVFGLLYPQS